MGKTRITILLALGASLLGAADAALDSGAPRPEAEASATVTVTAEALPVDLDQTPNPVQVIDKDDHRAAAAPPTWAICSRTSCPARCSTPAGWAPPPPSSWAAPGPRTRWSPWTACGSRTCPGWAGVNASAIDLAGIDRVEIQQGPCSTRFGSDALGGAVALYFRRLRPGGLLGRGPGHGGQPGDPGGRLGAAYGWDQGWVRLGVSAQREDQVLDPYNQYRSVGTFLGLGQQLGEDTLLTVNYFNSFSGVPIPIVLRGPRHRHRSSYHTTPHGRTSIAPRSSAAPCVPSSPRSCPVNSPWARYCRTVWSRT